MMMMNFLPLLLWAAPSRNVPCGRVRCPVLRFLRIKTPSNMGLVWVIAPVNCRNFKSKAAFGGGGVSDSTLNIMGFQNKQLIKSSIVRSYTSRVFLLLLLLYHSMNKTFFLSQTFILCVLKQNGSKSRSIEIRWHFSVLLYFRAHSLLDRRRGKMTLKREWQPSC